VDEGAHLTAKALTLSATATNEVTVDTTLVGIAGIIITYAKQTAKNTHEVDVYMGPRAGVAETAGLSGVINVNDAITGSAVSTNTATIDDFNFALGGVTVDVVQPQVTVGGATRAHVGGNFTITADAVTFSATGTNNATADTISVGIEGVGISVTEHPAKTEHTSEAFVPANANLTINGGSLTLTATSNNTADAGETGVDVAGLNVAVMTAAAETAGLTRACVEEGASVTATGLTLAATATNNANAKTAKVYFHTSNAIGGALYPSGFGAWREACRTGSSWRSRRCRS
jgi:hypothetical protein